MLRSMFSGVSGLRSHQTMMDVVGNNIANVNTTGFKSSSVVFADTLSQLTKAAGAPTDAAAGTNPAQVGLGVRVDAITTNMTQGSAQATGKSTDLMLQGDGMFAIQQGDGTFYSRNGSFTLDANGSVVTNDGGYVMGWKAETDGAINTNGQIGKLVIPSDTVMPAVATGEVTLKGNIDNTPANGKAREVTTSYTAYDAQGVASKIYVTFENVATTTAGPPPVVTPSNDWNVYWSIDPKDPKANPLTTTADPLNFGTSGAEADQDSFTIPGTPASDGDPVSPTGLDIKIDLTQLTAYVGTTGTSTINPVADGAPIGTLTGFSFGTDGVITGNYSNGYKQTLGQIAIASFNNAAGLRKEGNSLYSVSTNSGNPVFGIAGSAGRGAILAGSLEMSNVDLSAEFTNLILAQRGFQANSKVITSSDEILQDLVNLKR